MRAFEGFFCGFAAAVALATAGCGPAGDEGAEADAPAAFPNRRAEFPRDRPLGYVANRNSDDVSVIDLNAMTELGRVPVGRNPVDIDGPRHVTLDRERGLAYVALSYPNSYKGPHVETRGDNERAGYVVALSTARLETLAELRVEASPSDLALSADGSRLAISHYDEERAARTAAPLEERRAALGLVEPAFALAAGAASARFVSVCVAPSGVAYDALGTRAYVACTGEDSLAVVDTQASLVVARVPAGSYAANKPIGVALDPARARLLLSNQVAATVVVFGMNDSPTPIATAVTQGIPAGATWLDETRFLVALQDPDGAALIDAATGATLVQQSYAPEQCQKPSSVTVSADRVFLVCEGDHYRPGRVVSIDAASLSVTAGAAVGVYPDRLAVLLP